MSKQLDLSGKTGGIVHVRLESEDFDSNPLQIARLEGEEKLLGLFSFDLDMTVVSEAPESLDLRATMTAMLGSKATLVFEKNGETLRTVHGMISEIDESVDARSDKAGEAGAFRVTLVPRVFELSLLYLHEVFLQKSIPDIIATKLDRIGMTSPDDFEFRLAGNYPTREFVVQYKETDLAFITRLCEYYGITYYFEHGDKGDKIVFVDMQSAFEIIDSHATSSGQGDRVIKSLRSNSRVVPGARAVTDYNPVNPALDLQQKADVPGGFGGGEIELVTKYKTPEQGTSLSGIRAEETECHRVLLRGKSGSPSFRAGVVVPVSDAPTLDDPSILLTSVRHRITQQAGLLGSDKAVEYENTFEATRGKTQFRSALVTPRPRVHGVVTAFIEEYLDSGQYAVLDERGRYWVRFEFDSGEHASKHSLPIRMLQPHAGPGYGMHLPLKRGTEVMVSFLDGDVDRPVIVGSVPNELTQSPVNRTNFQINKLLKTETGIVIEARDVWEPTAPSIQQVPEE